MSMTLTIPEIVVSDTEMKAALERIESALADVNLKLAKLAETVAKLQTGQPDTPDPSEPPTVLIPNDLVLSNASQTEDEVLHYTEGTLPDLPVNGMMATVPGFRTVTFMVPDFTQVDANIKVIAYVIGDASKAPNVSSNNLAMMVLNANCELSIPSNDGNPPVVRTVSPGDTVQLAATSTHFVVIVNDVVYTHRHAIRDVVTNVSTTLAVIGVTALKTQIRGPYEGVIETDPTPVDSSITTVNCTYANNTVTCVDSNQPNWELLKPLTEPELRTVVRIPEFTSDYSLSMYLKDGVQGTTYAIGYTLSMQNGVRTLTTGDGMQSIPVESGESVELTLTNNYRTVQVNYRETHLTYHPSVNVQSPSLRTIFGGTMTSDQAINLKIETGTGFEVYEPVTEQPVYINCTVDDEMDQVRWTGGEYSVYEKEGMGVLFPINAERLAAIFTVPTLAEGDVFKVGLVDRSTHAWVDSGVTIEYINGALTLSNGFMQESFGVDSGAPVYLRWNDDLSEYDIVYDGRLLTIKPAVSLPSSMYLGYVWLTITDLEPQPYPMYATGDNADAVRPDDRRIGNTANCRLDEHYLSFDPAVKETGPNGAVYFSYARVALPVNPLGGSITLIVPELSSDEVISFGALANNAVDLDFWVANATTLTAGSNGCVTLSNAAADKSLTLRPGDVLVLNYARTMATAEVFINHVYQFTIEDFPIENPHWTLDWQNPVIGDGFGLHQS